MSNYALISTDKIERWINSIDENENGVVFVTGKIGIRKYLYYSLETIIKMYIDECENKQLVSQI